MNDPYFNFGECYVRGDTLYYIYVNDLMRKKELLQLTVRTIYPKVLIAQDKNAQCYCISVEENERIFNQKEDAMLQMRSI